MLTHEFQCRLPFARARIFRALTEPRELHVWFAEHVEVDLPAGDFRFWGKHTYGTPTRAHATQRLTRYEESQALAFTWTLHEHESEVTLRLEADSHDAAACTVNGQHRFERGPRIARVAELIDDLWRLNMGNLQAHLHGGAGLLLPDYGDPSPQVRVSIMIEAPREHVYQALLRPELLNQWIAIAAEVEPRVGGRYEFGWMHERSGGPVRTGPSRILQMIENEKLVVDWSDWRGDPQVPSQAITWLLETVGDATRVTLIHDGFVRTADISDYPFGWGYFLDRLRMCAHGEPLQPHEHGCSE